MKQSINKKEGLDNLATLNETRKEQVRRNFRDAAPILNDLRIAGYDVETFSDLGTDGKPYKEAVPVLLKWLPVVTNQDVKEAIVRALTVPWASSAVARAIIGEFHKADDHSLRWAIGNAMSVIATVDVTDEVIRIAADPRLGKSREMFVVALGRLPSPQAATAVLQLLDDEVVQGHAAMAAGKQGLAQALPQLKRLATHSKGWIRTAAKKAINSIERRHLKHGHSKKPN